MSLRLRGRRAAVQFPRLLATAVTMANDVFGEAELKQRIRTQAHAARRAQKNKDELSRRIVARFNDLQEYKTARTVMYYVDIRAEVRTRQALPDALASRKRIIVPWCNDDGELELFHLESMGELEIGMYSILEPRAELRARKDKHVAPQDLDLVMVPGVAFDRRGGRTGHGKGYYDKLLAQARPEILFVALAFECQLFDEIPMQPHDVFMDKIITESAVYEGVGGTGVSPPI